MSDPIDLRASRALKLIADLQTACAHFATQEDQLRSEYATRKFQVDRKHRHVQEDYSANLDERIATIRAEHTEWEEKVHDIHEQRRERINRAQRTGTRDLHKRAELVKERWLGSLQVKRISIERRATQKVKLAEAAYTTSIAALDDRSAKLLELDRESKRALSGYGSLRRMLSRAPSDPAGNPLGIEKHIAEIDQLITSASSHLESFKLNLIPRIFSGVGLAPAILLICVIGIILAAGLGLTEHAWMIAGGAVAALTFLTFVLWLIGLMQGKRSAKDLAEALTQAVRLHEEAKAGANNLLASEKAAAESTKSSEMSQINEQWDKAEAIKGDHEAMLREKLRVQVPRAWAHNDKHLNDRVDFIRAHCATLVRQVTAEMTGRHDTMTRARDTDLNQLNGEFDARWAALSKEWQQATSAAYAGINEMNTASEASPAPWTLEFAKSWKRPLTGATATRFGKLELDLAQLTKPTDPRLALPGPMQVSAPLALVYPSEGSLLMESTDSGAADIAGALNNIAFRLFSTMPPGKIVVTVIDPIGLGQNFAGLMHLGDYEDSVINRRIWTQRDQIEDRLAELNEHIEKVIQMYLRNEYASITEYNQQAGSTAEKYHFLIVADFPAGFSDTAAKRLQSIATSGPRCGVFSLIHWDKRQPSPDGLVDDELRKSGVVIQREKRGLVLRADGFDQGAARIVIDAPPADEIAVELVHAIGKGSIDANRVEVPFEVIAPKPGHLWEDVTTHEVRVPIGRTGATKLQYLAIGKGTKQHALFAGKTGSGKSTLFHVIITNLALHCDPDQVEFYLIDFKKGVEFKCYATRKLPHARVVAIESDREFGLSVLQRVDDELKRRGDLFRKLGVQDVAGYKAAGGAEPMPRTLLMIDEFQEFFVDDDAVAQGASLLFDRIVRQGRAFGIHVLLGSQTLGGAYTLARATLGQMVIRVALQCNEADAYLIMDENNPAPRLLSRPGEGIYNDSAGAVEGNSPFQVVWLADSDRDKHLQTIADLAKQRGIKRPPPIVFEGNAPAEVSENYLLNQALVEKPSVSPGVSRLWLGAPNSIKGPTEAAFQRQSGNHLMIVGQRDEAALAMVAMSILSLAAQYPKDGARFFVLHASTPESNEDALLQQIARTVPQQVTMARGAELTEMMEEVASIQRERNETGAESEPSIVVFILGMQKFKKLRAEDEFSFSLGGESDSGSNPATTLTNLITEGSTLGLHLITTVDTYNNVSRYLSRKSLSEIELRVVFQMSANDSATLIESPKASELGLHRAIFYNQQEGLMETFRPYALPDSAWLANVAESLSQRS
ncbi:MAG: ATP-binding protein [Verrucomicrobiaceae bacterium]|nr:ATP-binding protein [Verrucomicrobiaceae bacterium]